MIEVKGSAITARIRFVRERYGESALRSVKDDLSAEHRRLLDARILPHQWAPFDLFIALSVAADRQLGLGDLRLCRDMGRFSAAVNLPTLYRIFYRLGTPAFILDRAARLWSVHYTSGSLAVERDGEGIVRLRIEDFAEPHRAHCLSVLGWAERSAELSGAKIRAAEELSCRSLGDPRCELRLDWAE